MRQVEQKGGKVRRRVTMSSPYHPVVLFTRENERRLEALRSQSDPRTGGSLPPLTPDEEKELATLEAQYQQFLDEGERRLRAGISTHIEDEHMSSSNNPEGSTSTASSTSWLSTAANMVGPLSSITDTAGTVGRAAYFWTSLIGTAVPGYIGKKVGITSDFDHWNFITDRLILGALPVITKVGTSGNHLTLLRTQLEERQQRLGLVVACLGEEEMLGFGVNLLEFAREHHWHEFVSPRVEYCYVPMIDGTAEVTMENARNAVDRMHEILDIRKECAYVHCKAGKGRSWMLVMCYLATYGGRTFENAEALVSMTRRQVNPSRVQREFARDFCKKFYADELAKKLLAENCEPE